MRSRDVESYLRRLGAAVVARRFGRSLSTVRRWLKEGVPAEQKERVVKRILAATAKKKPKKRQAQPSWKAEFRQEVKRQTKGLAKADVRHEAPKRPAKKRPPTKAPRAPKRAPEVIHSRGKKPKKKRPGRERALTKAELQEALEDARKQGKREGIKEERDKRRQQIDEIYKDLKKPIPSYRERRRRAKQKIRRAMKRQKNLSGEEVRALIEALAEQYQLLAEDVWLEWRKVYR